MSFIPRPAEAVSEAFKTWALQVEKNPLISRVHLTPGRRQFFPVNHFEAPVATGKEVIAVTILGRPGMMWKIGAFLVEKGYDVRSSYSREPIVIKHQAKSSDPVSFSFPSIYPRVLGVEVTVTDEKKFLSLVLPTEPQEATANQVTEMEKMSKEFTDAFNNAYVHFCAMNPDIRAQDIEEHYFTPEVWTLPFKKE